MLIIYIFFLTTFMMLFLREEECLQKVQKLITPRAKPSQMLALKLSEILLGSHSEIKIGTPLQDYKFFSTLVYKIYHFHQSMGADIFEGLKTIRSGLTLEIKNEMKVHSVESASIYQYLVLTVVTWVFVLILRQQVAVDVFLIGISFFLQVMGLMIHFSLKKTIKARLFKDFDRYFEVLYSLKALCSIEIPISALMERAGVTSLQKSPAKVLVPIHERLMVIVRSQLQGGQDPRTDLQNLSDELWHLRESCLEQYFKSLMVLRYSMVFLFYLPSFLVVIWGVMGKVMTEL